MDIEAVLAKVAPATKTVSVCVDGTIAGRLDELNAQWAAAVRHDEDHNEAPTAPAVAERIDALRAEADAATVTFKVASIGASGWRRLVTDHPPPDESWRWDPATFGPAALAATCVDPKMTEEDAVELAERLSDGAWQRLFAAVLEVNIVDPLPNFVPGIGAASNTGPSSTTPPPEASPGVSG